MRISKNFELMLSILLASILSIGLFENAGGQETGTDYYVVDGQRIELAVSQKYMALKVAPAIDAAGVQSLKATIDSGAVGIVRESPVLERYGIVLVEIGEGVGPSSFRTAMDNMSATEEVESQNPVYSIGEVDQVLTNEFIVQFTSDASEESINRSLSSRNAEIIEKHDKIANRYTVRFPGKSAREALAISNQYHQDALVEFSEPNFIRIVPKRPQIEEEGMEPEGALTPPTVIPSDPLFSKQWYLNNTGAVGNADADIDAPEAWDIDKGSPGIIVAIIDEGVDINHEDLKNKIVTPYDATDGDNNQQPKSWDGHGTACAGIAAAITNNNKGVAGTGWKTKIMPVRIAYSNYDGGDWITSNLIIEDGIRTAVDRGARVLSNSWGGGSPSSAINSAIDYAINNKCVVVFAAGNWSTSVIYPANLSSSKVMMAVSATNEWDEFKTTTSSDGESWWGSCFGPQINVAAPGVHIYTTDISGTAGYSSGNYVSNFNGTSSATPIVAGVAALLLSQNPGWGPTKVRNRLQTTADDLGASGFDNKFGHGRVNACKALGGCANGLPGNCATISAVGPFARPNIGQIMLHVALLFSTILLFFIFQAFRKFKKTIL